MTAKRFDVLLSCILLVLALAYTARMAAYPDRAGVVPAIVGAVMAGALLIQLVVLRRKHDPQRSSSAEPAAAVDAGAHALGGEAPPPEPEPDTYDTLIALKGERRNKFLTIVVFTLALYAATLVAGFVVAPAVLIPVLLLVLREPWWVVAAGAVAAAAASYAFVVGLLGLPVIDGYLRSFINI